MANWYAPFCPKPPIGNILDSLNFAHNFEKMTDMNSKQEPVDRREEIDINADENQGGTTHLNEPVETENEMEKIKAELEECRDKYLRKVAEFDNMRKRNAKERIELIQTAGADVIRDLLDVLDDCDRAQKQLENLEDSAEKEGIILVFNKLRNTLGAKGLKLMESKETDFDPELHEAISEIPAPTPELSGKVIDEVTKGYYLNGTIIRHAKVVVGK